MTSQRTTKTIAEQKKPTPDREIYLISRLKKKEAAAMKELYDAYGACLYGIILRIVGVEAIAQDVLQEAFLKVWDKIQSYDPKRGRFFTWMLNIARNTAIDKTRSRMFKEGAYRNEMTTGKEPFYVEKIECIGVKDLLDKIKPAYKDVLDLLYFKGMTHAEAAKSLDLPLGTVKTRCRAAIQQLRKVLYT